MRGGPDSVTTEPARPSVQNGARSAAGVESHDVDRFADLPSLSNQVSAVLLAIANEPDALGLRLNDVASITSLPTGHIGRHLRTLENNRLVDFGAGRWRVTLRGRRVASELPAAPRSLTA